MLRLPEIRVSFQKLKYTICWILSLPIREASSSSARRKTSVTLPAFFLKISCLSLFRLLLPLWQKNHIKVMAWHGLRLPYVTLLCGYHTPLSSLKNRISELEKTLEVTYPILHLTHEETGTQTKSTDLFMPLINGRAQIHLRFSNFPIPLQL